MKTVNILCTLVCTMLLAVLPAAAQNTNDDKNKAIIEPKPEPKKPKRPNRTRNKGDA